MVIRVLVAAVVMVAAFAAPFAVVGLTGDEGPTPATARSVSGFPLERVAEDFDPPARTAVVRDFRAAAPLPALRRQRARRAPAPRRTAAGGSNTAAVRPATPSSSGGASEAATSSPAPAPAPPPASTPAPVRRAPAPAPAASPRPAPDDFDSGESFDSTG